MPDMTLNGSQPERLNSRTITVWLPEQDIAYLDEVAVELGLAHDDTGKPIRNAGLRAIIADHRKLRARRLAKKS